MHYLLKMERTYFMEKLYLTKVDKIDNLGTRSMYDILFIGFSDSRAVSDFIKNPGSELNSFINRMENETSYHVYTLLKIDELRLDNEYADKPVFGSIDIVIYCNDDDSYSIYSIDELDESITLKDINDSILVDVANYSSVTRSRNIEALRSIFLHSTCGIPVRNEIIYLEGSNTKELTNQLSETERAILIFHNTSVWDVVDTTIEILDANTKDIKLYLFIVDDSSERVSMVDFISNQSVGLKAIYNKKAVQ